MQLETYLQQKTSLISERLVNFVQQQKHQSEAFDYPVIDFLEKFVVSGKLYRGGLVFLSYDLFAETKSEELVQEELQALIKTAMAVELTHSAFLLHDDVMDRDDLRRGDPSFHALVKSFVTDKQVDDSLHLGYSQAISVGDMLIFWAGQLLQTAAYQTGHPQLFQTYTQEMIKTVWGQMDDVYLAHLDQTPKIKEIVNVLSLKSGHYSVANPLLLGAILAGASEKKLKQLTQFGVNMGIVFQVKDDELGLIGDEIDLGKQVGSDIEENKKTLFWLFLFEQATNQEKKKLKEVFGNSNISQKNLEYVQELLNKYQVSSLVESYLQQHYQKAEQALDSLSLDKKARQLLEQLMQLLKNRKK